MPMDRAASSLAVDSATFGSTARVWVLTALAAAFALVSGMGVLWLDLEANRHREQREAMSLAVSQASLLHQRLESSLSSTYALAAVLKQGQYQIDPATFEPFARELMKYNPGISSLQLAPRGVVTYVVPLEGNERAIGHNLMTSIRRNKEAMQAIATRRLTLAGPFDLIQGGVAVVGRLPIFVTGQEGGGEDDFWGFASALVRIPELLRSADIDRLERLGYDYTLWRVHPDDGKRQVFARSGLESLPDAVTHELEVPNGKWFFSVQPKRGWLAEYGLELAIKAGAVILFAILIGAVVRVLLIQPVRLRREVELRTRDLTDANSRLADEIFVRREAEWRLRLSAKVLDSSAEAIVITDAQQHIVYVNRAFCQTTGYDAGEVMGKTPAVLNSGRHDEVFFAGMRAALDSDGHWQGEIWNRRRNGEVFPQWMGISVLRDDSGSVTNYVSIALDISERKAAEERLHYVSHYDALTGLPNRVLLRDRLQQAIALADRTHGKVAMLSLDLDRFKVINDTLGHQAGDELLQQVVARLQEVVRGSDTISRQGGDEFIIVAPEQAAAGVATRIAQKIQERLQQPFRVRSDEVRVTSSVGIAIYPDDGTDFETLLKKCDIAMYHAKESGRATYRFYTEALNLDADAGLRLEAELQRALQRHEFVLHYQPQIDIESGKVVGAEALVRWQHPERGLLSPAKFIPLAEESGLIVGLGDWVMREACRQNRAWQRDGLPPIPVSVNLSAPQMHDPAFAAHVGAILTEAELAPQWLELELTESILIQDAEHVLETVRALKLLGVRLSIDDFGTGYSSLAYLKRFAVDKLKIDQSFIRDLCRDGDDAAIVQAVIQLGRSLNLRTLAEGAETIEQVDYLRENGCLHVQGFYFSKPLPADEFAAFLKTRA